MPSKIQLKSSQQPSHIHTFDHIKPVISKNVKARYNTMPNLTHLQAPNNPMYCKTCHSLIKPQAKQANNFFLNVPNNTNSKNATQVLYQRCDHFMQAVNNFVKTTNANTQQTKKQAIKLTPNALNPKLKNSQLASKNTSKMSQNSQKPEKNANKGDNSVNKTNKNSVKITENNQNKMKNEQTSDQKVVKLPTKEVKNVQKSRETSPQKVAAPLENSNKMKESKNLQKPSGEPSPQKAAAPSDNLNKVKESKNSQKPSREPSPQKMTTPTENVNAVKNAPKQSKEPSPDKDIDAQNRNSENIKTQSVISKQTSFGNPSIQTVTQKLADIIKNFQQQITTVASSKIRLEEVPSAMIQPKEKEFFKKDIEEAKNDNKTQSQELQKSSLDKSVKPNSSPSISPKSSTIRFRRFHSYTTHSLINNIDPLKQLKEEVQKAIRERKTFTVRGQFYPIRRALLARGWVEKYHVSYKDQLSQDLKRYHTYAISELLPLLRNEDLADISRGLIKSKLLGNYQIDFYWGVNDEAFKENPEKVKLTMINKLKRDIFSYTNKQGLCEASKLSHWYQKQNVSKLNHPRSYSLGKNGDLNGFIEDFNITAAMAVLKWVVKINTTKECKLLSPTGKIPLETFDFAMNECCKFIKKAKHEDIDKKIPEAKEEEWNQFLEYFYKLVHYNNHFKAEGYETEDSLVRKSNYILNNLKSFYPYTDMDGMMNIWILKPISSSRGRGIHMCRTLQYVLKTIKQNSNVRYIIQKYIERPLLIYNTKFDIRQWFLISNCCPLTIWMYKECYLRFSSQTYNLRKLHESIHLTNNSVQCKYKNNSVDSALPSYNMWDSIEFQRYLSNIGYPNAFKDIIYSGMKQSVTAAVLMHQEKMVIRRNCFELYGADFMLTEDFQPWLIEINSNPALFASTPITARMCPKVLEDVIKVVIDYAQNNKADTGSFELIYKEQMTKVPANLNLELHGLPLQRSYFFNPTEQEMKKTTNSLVLPVQQPQDSLKVFGEEIKKTLNNLLQILHNEKQKRGVQKKCNNLKNVA